MSKHNTKSMTERRATELADLCKMLGEPIRLQLAHLLSSGERPVMDLWQALNLPQNTVSHHLGLMRMSNLFLARRVGKQVFYSLTDRCRSVLTALDAAVPIVVPTRAAA